MKTLLISLLIAFSALVPSASFGQTTVPATATGTYSLTVVISGVNQRSGTLRVGLANSEASFSGESFKAKTIAVPASGEVQVVFDSLPAGKYAVRILHDLNSNEKMDYTGGMPDEPFGFSNITILTGPPSFSQAAFDLNESRLIEVRLMSM